MLSASRKHSLFLAFCAFITVWLMSAGMAASAHAHAAAPLHGAMQSASDVVSPSSAGEQLGWQHAVGGDYACSECSLIDDLDNELVLPSPWRLWLNYYLSAAPASAGAPLYFIPVASPLRPPSLA